MPTIGKIRVNLEGDTRSFDRSMRRSARQVQTFQSRLRALRNTFIPLTGALGFGSLIRATVEEANQLGDLSKRLGVSVDSFSRLARVLKRSGTGMSQTATILQRLQRRAADAQDGNEGLSSAFRQLGIDVSRFVRLDPVEAFLQVAGALSKVTPQAERIQLAFKLLDSEGVQVLQANLPNLRKEMAATSAISDAQAKKIKELADAWTKLGESMRTVTAQTFSALASPADTGAQAALITRGLTNALDPARGIRESVLGWIRGTLGLGDSPGFQLQAPRTGFVQPGHFTNIPPETGLTGPIQGDRTFVGGDLAASNAVLDLLRGIRRNTEKGGAVLQ